MYIKDLREKIGHDPILSVSCGAIIENEKEEILLQLRKDTKNFGVPGGSIELKETLMESLKREVLEETGIAIDETKTRLYGVYSGEKCRTIYPNGDIVYYVCFIFHVSVDSKVKLMNQEDEGEFIKFYSRENLPLENLKESDSIWINKWKNKDNKLDIL
ncbi:MutT/nudix family protein [Alteracholeplasma palmae J233]|uniref:MutT/nudix family protein n=1 Tax=Alteracholeplasma palmae (strain ATCC 49389 / J233) TaxID=1318466 RepID=U4KJN0_ALTPJ|nr:NUDIX domain-containing protein [Alteracholeplasma palmae]CCV63734.1 MutT/nudix family protein [Alteracholeplasma palmae J233]